ncbi:MAG: hypothetical protein AAF628_09245 [Planctomycetota bacterium]
MSVHVLALLFWPTAEERDARNGGALEVVTVATALAPEPEDRPAEPPDQPAPDEVGEPTPVATASAAQESGADAIDRRAHNLAAPGVLIAAPPEPEPMARPDDASAAAADVEVEVAGAAMPSPDPIGADVPETAAAEPTERVGVGVEGLPLPPAVFRDQGEPVLLLDHRQAEFEKTAVGLGFQFIVFEDVPRPQRYFELSGPNLRRRSLRQQLDHARFSTRAFDFTHVPRYRALRLDLAERCFIEPSRCRLAAVVPHELRRQFAAEEKRALVQLERAPREVRALFGTLARDPHEPLEVTAAMLLDGSYVSVR